MDEEERVRLRDGTTVVVRPVRPDDHDLFRSGFERMSQESRYRRFVVDDWRGADSAACCSSG